MFRSRNKASLWQKAAAFFWPQAGWRRSTKYVAHRVARIKGTPYSIACGFACGAAISFTPFVGLHLIGGAFMAWVLRGNLVASWIGTLVGNPWTFPFIWVFIYKLGIFMGADVRENQAEHLDFYNFFEQLLRAVKTFNGQFIFDTAWPVLWPMIVGGMPCFFIAWFAFFFPIRELLRAYRAKQEKRRATARRRKFTGTVQNDGT